MKSQNNFSLKIKIFYLIIFISIIIFTFFIKVIDWVIILVIFGFLFYFLILSLLISKKYPTISDSKPFPKKVPTVAVVTYAFNNFQPILDTINCLKKLKYPIPFYVYVITDGTCKFLNNVPGVKQIILPKSYFKKDSSINLKSRVINEGLKHIKEENIFQVDGDTIPEKDALLKLTGTLKDNVAMVIGSIGVKNDNTFLEKIQTVEYNFGFGYPRLVLTAIDSLDVATGAFCLYNKKKILSVGGYDIYNITEDKEIAYKLIEKGFSVEFVVDAKAKTVVPNTIKDFFIQRMRWYRGGYDVTAKYIHLFYKKNQGYFNFYLIYTTLALIIGMMFVAKTTYDIIGTIVANIYYYLSNLIAYGIDISAISLSHISFNPFFSSLLLLFIISAIFALYFMSISFSYNNFKIKKKYILPIIYLIFVHGFILLLISIISIIYGVFGVKYRW